MRRTAEIRQSSPEGMRTSISSIEAPSLPSLPFEKESSVLVSREVLVSSNRAPTASLLQPTTKNAHVPSVTPVAASGSDLHDWDSKSPEKSWMLSRTPGSIKRGSREPGQARSGRESMKALSDFLMTKDPPPTNLMSIPAEEERDLTSLKKGALRFFKKRKRESPRLMKLPDSAVAAHTRSGSRHIAISIPMEYAHVQEAAPTTPLRQFPSRPPTPSTKSTTEQRSAATTLKPVEEVWESASTSLPGDGEETLSGPPSPLNANFSPSILIPFPKPNVRPISGHNPDLARSHSPPSTRNDPQASQKSYIAVSPFEGCNDDLRLNEIRESVETVLSQMSSATSTGHTPGVSSVSMAPTVTPKNPDFPPRSSSIFRTTKNKHDQSTCNSNLINEEEENQVLDGTPNPPPADRPGYSISTSPSLPAELGVAVRGYNASGRPQVVRNGTPKPSESGPLPDAPEGLASLPVIVALPQNVFVPRTSTAAPLRTSSVSHAAPSSKDRAETTAAASRANPNRDGMEESILATRQYRQERVKARKLRDMESLRAQSDSRRPLTESRDNDINVTKDPTQSQAVLTAPRRSSKRGPRGPIKASVNSLSPIMLVADLPPCPETASDLPFRISSIRDLKRTNRTSLKSPPLSATLLQCKSNFTLPLSSFSPYDSDSDVLPPTTSIASNNVRTSITASSRSSAALSTRREERRTRRNVKLREKEMDARLNKMEHDNILLLQTLGGVAESFGTLGRVGMDRLEERRLSGRGRPSDELWSSPTTGEGVDSFMQELRSGGVPLAAPAVRGLGLVHPSPGIPRGRTRGRCSRGEKEDYEDEEEG
ncbi:uncharacterized protein L3040_000106 [Drepanopeziza brunnea f. sp. 'multigermtubi']|uniref:Uncharacterized protein n=1 Tax=Marssonina brunnea f. sp. multigermtubi (strain MB_m1) TaxID=1072389 RepID=K1XPW9_MARBU|nr:uncharacterized protein MBM_07305 [Drepanopeziza brunnea f. sp. 'multigermtubi' MB_m1]EKD14584.1 hypothetical protein MBM_07305 [Drepanopeziza brunnea f. sp. 'multigermtubi' MB_m1]KAJ5053815.1 hypothetical protein L3040_000106 [Drepanopeziza brunnea f. sp. 'multigermtubi']